MKILVATDGTEQGQAAVDMAGSIAAAQQDAQVEVVSVYEAPAMTAGAPYVGMPVWYPDLVSVAKAKATGAAAAAQKAVMAECPAVAVNSVVCMGGPASSIVEIADEWGADLIVVGSHGYGFWGRTFYGSVSEQVVHHAHCSVLVARSH